MKLSTRSAWFLVPLVLAACGAPAGQGTVPRAPSDVTATPGPGYVTVAWTDESEDESGFRIYRDEDSSASLATQAPTVVGSVGPDGESFVDHSAQVGVTYAYTVAAEGAEGESSPATADAAARIERGVEFTVGTVDRPGDAPNAMAVMIYYVFPPDELEGAELEFTIEGPDGWRAEPLVWQETEEGLQDRWRSLTVLSSVATAGTYELEVTIDGIAYTDSAVLEDAGYELGEPEIRVESTSTGTVTASWTPPSAARSFISTLWTEDWSEVIAESAIVTDTNHTFSGLSLEPGSYRVEVVNFNTDLTQPMPPLVRPYAVSYLSSEPFPVGLVDIAGVWNMTLLATESTCESVPVATEVVGDVLFELDGDQVTATAQSGAVSTGTRDGNDVFLTRTDETEVEGTYEVESQIAFTDDAMTGESLYAFDRGCEVSWDVQGARVP